MAEAGFGYLNQDWLANTLDPTPIFSKLVYLTYSLIPWPPVFYLYYAILAGVYLFSLYGILSACTPCHELATQTLADPLLAPVYSLGGAAGRWLCGFLIPVGLTCLMVVLLVSASWVRSCSPALLAFSSCSQFFYF